ncbi:Fic family protein [Sphingomonas profundi]|uniref:Fic family protein n=1 Tax=Alterirhizorhabdus profundi TaxID=2681549 RepID=UPI0012E90243|nr:Fic family protein [Sphingomonas profundi]
MSEEQRHSEAEEPALVADEDERARLEAENAVRQFDRVLDLIDEVERDGRPFRLKVSTIQGLHRLALDGLSRYAGNWRPGGVTIGLSKHLPPAQHLVPGLMEELCDWINDRWELENALTLCAYSMWRLNWIHPFDDGNGRTSRAVAYLVLCAKMKSRLPGRLTIPEIISNSKAPYYSALESIDESCKGSLDLSPLSDLLSDCLAKQLSDAWEAATHKTTESDNSRKFH